MGAIFIIKILCNKTEDCTYMIPQHYKYDLKCPTCGSQITIEESVVDESVKFGITS